MFNNGAEISFLLVSFIFSVICHEFAHAFAAFKLGDSLAEREGLMTFNPLPHIQREPMGMILIPLLCLYTGGYLMGWGSVPYDPLWKIRNPRKAGLMALCGPIANLCLALIGIIFLIIVKSFIFNPTDFSFSIYENNLFLFIFSFIRINILLFSINLIPLPPLDGYSILYIFANKKWQDKMLSFEENNLSSLLGILGIYLFGGYFFIFFSTLLFSLF